MTANFLQSIHNEINPTVFFQSSGFGGDQENVKLKTVKQEEVVELEKENVYGEQTISIVKDVLKKTLNNISNKKALLFYAGAANVVIQNPDNSSVINIALKERYDQVTENINSIESKPYIKYKDPLCENITKSVNSYEEPNPDQSMKDKIVSNYFKIFGNSFKETGSDENYASLFSPQESGVNCQVPFNEQSQNGLQVGDHDFSESDNAVDFDIIGKKRWLFPTFNSQRQDEFVGKKLDQINFVNGQNSPDKSVADEDDRMSLPSMVENATERKFIKMKESYFNKMYDIPLKDDIKYAEDHPQEFQWNRVRVEENERRKNYYLYPPKKRHFMDSFSEGKKLFANPELHQYSTVVPYISTSDEENKKVMKDHSCNFCTRSFKSNSAKIIHERIHTGEKPYPCNFCSKKFKSNYEKVIHERTHTGEKPYECGICNKKFTSLSYKKIHHRIHTGEKPYSCTQCHRAFKSLREVKVHEVIHGLNE